MLSHLLLRDFRCFEEVRLDLHPETTLLVGRNAQGKTSLLEAACLLLRLQSPRTATRTDLIRFGSRVAMVEGGFAGNKLRFAQGLNTRRLAINESVCGRSLEYLKHSGLVVWMDHADMQLIRGGAECRRRYLDFAAAQLFPHYLPALRNYERVLRSRNYVLKKEASINWKQVEAYAALLGEHGAVLESCRSDLAGRLQPHIAQAHHHLSGQVEEVRVAYRRGYNGDSLEKTLFEARVDETKSRSTAVGVHRDDLLLEINGRDAGAFASEGQQRTLSLALKLSQARVLEESRGEPPLLLMDDIFGELDKARRSALLSYLPAHAQKIITTTFMDWAREEDLRGDHWTVEAGKLSR